jgi:streptomycin 6-kinase
LDAAPLQRYLKNWRLSQPQLLATTATSSVYLVTRGGDKAVLKLLSDLGVKDESNGARALEYFGGSGAVRLLAQDTGAHLLEYADGDDLKTLVRRGGDAGAAGIIGEVLNVLHAAKGPVPELIPLKIWFRSLFRAAAQPGADALYVRAATTAERLLALNEAPRVLHGDIHHENIRHSDRGWLALDPKGLYGPRLYDAANTLCNPSGMEEISENEARLLNVAGILAEKLGTPRPRLLAWVFAYAGLSASWGIEDKQDPAHALAIARFAEPHMEKR